jgi:hypothetical protein
MDGWTEKLSSLLYVYVTHFVQRMCTEYEYLSETKVSLKFELDLFIGISRWNMFYDLVCLVLWAKHNFHFSVLFPSEEWKYKWHNKFFWDIMWYSLMEVNRFFSEQHTASASGLNNKPSKKQGESTSSYWLLAWFNFSFVKTEAVCSSKTPVNFYSSARLLIPEDSTLHSHYCENLISKIFSCCPVTWGLRGSGAYMHMPLRILLGLTSRPLYWAFADILMFPEQLCLNNKKFWDKLIAYFRLLWHRLHRKLCVQQFFCVCMCLHILQ